MAARHHIHLFSANLAGGYDNRIFSGQSLAFDPTGQLLARGKAFAEDVLVVDTAAPENNDIQPLASCIEEAVWRALTLGVRDFVRKCGGERVIVGLSGGMDSALVCSVAAEALGPENVFGMLMPSPYSSKGSVDDSLALAANLGVKTVTLPIEPLMDCYRQSLAPGLECFPPYEGELTFENIQARIRGSLLAALANRARALILNTGNKSEGGMGYCTLYGDAVGALAVIGDLTKTEVYAVGRWYNASRGQEIIPTAIFDKAPSAELRPGQKDEDSLPPYDQLDPVLEGLLASSALGEKDSHPDGAGELTREVRRRLFTSEFKRRQSPPALFVSRVPSAPAGPCPWPAVTACPRAGRNPAGQLFCGGKGGLFAKSPPFPPHPLSPSKTLAGKMAGRRSAPAPPCPTVPRRHDKRASIPVTKKEKRRFAGGASVRGRPDGNALPFILPVKFFAGWMGGAGGRKGAFLQKSSLPSPRMTRLHSPAAFPFFPLEAPCGLR